MDWLRRLVTRQPRSWPEGVPRLYPGTTTRQRLQIAHPSVAPAQRRARVVMICPLFEAGARPSMAASGLLVSRLLQEGLSRVPGLSLRGPEDTPLGSLQITRRMLQSCQPADVVISGRIQLEQRPSVELILMWKDRAEQALCFRARSLEVLIFDLLTILSVALGGTVTPALQAHWMESMPPSEQALLAAGALLSMPSSDATQLIDLWREHPRFTAPLHGLHQRQGSAALLLEACASRPDDPRLHLMAFERLWDGALDQPAQLQYLRRALELAPGMGRAWLYASHAVSSRSDQLAFAEVAYRLLPGDPGASSSYVRTLREQHHNIRQCVQIAFAGIEADPFGPGNYEFLIEHLEAMGRRREALAVAQRLQMLYEPEIHERTRHYFWLDPTFRSRIRDDSWDPAAEVQRRIDRLTG